MTRSAPRARTNRKNLLAADTDRDAVLSALSDGYATGRLSLEELNQRTAAAFAARTRGDLDAVTQGLGDVAAARAPAGDSSSALFAVAIVAILSVPLLALAWVMLTRGG